jgi:hypothetical protein
MRLLLIAVDLYRARQKRDRCPEMIIACYSQRMRLDVIQTAVFKKMRLFFLSFVNADYLMATIQQGSGAKN